MGDKRKKKGSKGSCDAAKVAREKRIREARVPLCGKR
jgi:hypothetical protein